MRMRWDRLQIRPSWLTQICAARTSSCTTCQAQLIWGRRETLWKTKSRCCSQASTSRGCKVMRLPSAAVRSRPQQLKPRTKLKGRARWGQHAWARWSSSAEEPWSFEEPASGTPRTSSSWIASSAVLCGATCIIYSNYPGKKGI